MAAYIPLQNSTFCLSFEPEDSMKIGIARAVTGAGNLLVSLSTLAIIFALKAFKSHAHRLFLYLIVGTLLHSLSYILEIISIDYKDDTSEQPFCTISGVYTMYMSWVQNLVVLWITIYLFHVIVLRVMPASINKDAS